MHDVNYSTGFVKYYSFCAYFTFKPNVCWIFFFLYLFIWHFGCVFILKCYLCETSDWKWWEMCILFKLKSLTLFETFNNPQNSAIYRSQALASWSDWSAHHILVLSIINQKRSSTLIETAQKYCSLIMQDMVLYWMTRK